MARTGRAGMEATGSRAATPSASYGTFNVVWQIEACKALGLPYLYLGYWIKESPKMAYKSRFMPIEGFIGGEWRRLAPEDLE